LNLTDGYRRCYACAHGGDELDVIVPISYSVGGEQMHRVLAGYKRLNGAIGRRLQIELAAVLWRFLALHEKCVAAASGTAKFTSVTTVPSGDLARDEVHPLRWIVRELVAPVRGRYERLLRRSAVDVHERVFDVRRFEPVRDLRGESVLLLDDTWTTGASAQSAAGALRQAGAEHVAAVVLGRHVNRGWGTNDERLRALEVPFPWNRCVLQEHCRSGVAMWAAAPAAGHHASSSGGTRDPPVGAAG
jgi:hypothetical protein